MKDKLKNYLIEQVKPNCYVIKGFYCDEAFHASVYKNNNSYNININGYSYVVENKHQKHDFTEENNNNKSELKAPMTGIIRDILVKENEYVILGQLIYKIESMKLILSIESPCDGIIKAIRVRKGQKVLANDLIMEIDINNEK